MKKLKSVEFVSKPQKDMRQVKRAHTAAMIIADQVNSLLGLKDIQEDPKKGFIGIPVYDLEEGVAGVILLRSPEGNTSPLTSEKKQSGRIIDDNVEEVMLCFRRLSKNRLSFSASIIPKGGI